MESQPISQVLETLADRQVRKQWMESVPRSSVWALVPTRILMNLHLGGEWIWDE